MKKNEQSDKDQILRIRPQVVFRLSSSSATTKSKNLNIQIKDLRNNEQYELKASAAHLWLCLDGMRTRSTVIRFCQKFLATQDPRFSKMANKLLNDLLEIDLIFDQNSQPQKDPRASDMVSFLRQLRAQKMDCSYTRSKTKSLKRKILPKDQFEFRKAKKVFLDLLGNRVRIKLSRASNQNFDGHFHVVLSQITIPELKKTSEGLGAGFSLERAALAAIGESLERPFSFTATADLESKSFRELEKEGTRALDPAALNFFNPSQSVIQSHEAVNLTQEMKTDWTWFDDSAAPNKKILIPAGICGTRSLAGIALCKESTSSGCALATDPNRAKLNAAFELIERDHLSFYWRTKNSPQLIEFSNPNERLENLLKKIGSKVKNLRVFSLESELSTTTVQAVFLGNPKLNEPLFTSGTATRLDPVEAIEKAVSELFYVVSGNMNSGSKCRISYGNYFDNSVWGFDDHGYFYNWYRKPQAYDFLLAKNIRKISWKTLISRTSGDDLKDLEFLSKNFVDNGLRLYFKDNSPHWLSDLGIWVCRAFSPDLIPIEAAHRFRRLGLPRYFQLAQKLNLPNQPSQPDQLSPWPHPLP